MLVQSLLGSVLFIAILVKTRESELRRSFLEISGGSDETGNFQDSILFL